MCLQYKPTVVACFCIHLACKWSQWEIPLSNEKKEWFSYVDPSVTAELLQQLTEEFLVVFDQSQSRLKQLALKSQSPFVSSRSGCYSFKIVAIIVYRNMIPKRENLQILKICTCIGHLITVKGNQVMSCVFCVCATNCSSSFTFDSFL